METLVMVAFAPVTRSTAAAIDPLQPTTPAEDARSNRDLVTMVVLLAVTLAIGFLAFGGGA